MVSNGSAAKLTFVNYAFGNLYQKNGGYECGIVNKAEPGATNPTAVDAGTGGDAWADFGRTSSRRVDPADTIKWDDQLAGNFRELKALKAKFPNLKVMISLGGWTWSKWFSAASQTDALRKQLVSSCIDVYVKGNLPVIDGRGGAGAAAGVFDGIDIDWEFPGGGAQPYNTVSPADKQNFTLLLAEFRRQLDALKATTGKAYPLSAAIVIGKDKIEQTEPAKYIQYLDWLNLMAYDFHGTWENGVTDFQSNLYADPASPNIKAGGNLATYTVDAGVKTLIAAGAPANKLVMGVPFYGRGWKNVPAGAGGDGLYQSAAGGAAPGTWEAGFNDYKVLKNLAGVRKIHPVTKQLYLYTPDMQWWSYDDATVIGTKVDYVKANGLGGLMSWSIDGDDSAGTLTGAMSKVRN